MRYETISIAGPGSMTRLSCATRARSRGEAILCIHGLGCRGEAFEALWTSSRFDNYTVVIPDLPGHGQSSLPAGFSCSLEAYKNSLLRLIQRFDKPHWHVVGHSLGGAIGVLVARELGDALASFTTIEGNLIGPDCSLLSRRVVSQSRKEFIKHGFDALRNRLRNEPDVSIQRWVEWMSSCSPSGFYDTSQSLVNWSDSGQLLKIFLGLSCPKLYVYGDRNDTMEVLNELQGVIRHAINNSGHFVMIDNPDNFCQVVSDFILSNPGQSSSTH